MTITLELLSQIRPEEGLTAEQVQELDCAMRDRTARRELSPIVAQWRAYLESAMHDLNRQN